MSVKSYLLLFENDLLSIIDYSNELVEPILVYGEKKINANEHFWSNQKKFWKWLSDKESLRAEDTLNIAFASSKKSVLEQIVFSSNWHTDWSIDAIISVLTQCHEQNINIYFERSGRNKKIFIDQGSEEKKLNFYVKGYSSESLDLYLQLLKKSPKVIDKEEKSDQKQEDANGLGFVFFENQMKKNDANRIARKIKKNAKVIKVVSK